MRSLVEDSTKLQQARCKNYALPPDISLTSRGRGLFSSVFNNRRVHILDCGSGLPLNEVHRRTGLKDRFVFTSNRYISDGLTCDLVESTTREIEEPNVHSLVLPNVCPCRDHKPNVHSVALPNVCPCREHNQPNVHRVSLLKVCPCREHNQPNVHSVVLPNLCLCREYKQPIVHSVVLPNVCPCREHNQPNVHSVVLPNVCPCREHN
jgi:hypothetical protein